VERAKPKLGLGTQGAILRAAREHSIRKGETDPVVLAEEAALLGEGFTKANLRRITKARQLKGRAATSQGDALREFQAQRAREVAKQGRIPG
jgi:hypothetical protein